METINPVDKMPKGRHCPRIDTLELKHHIQMKLGPEKSDKYFGLLNKFLSLRLSKPEFDKLCIVLLGSENISLHNGLIRAIIKNACLANAPPNKDPKPQFLLNGKSTNGCQTSLHLLRNVFPQSPRKGRNPICRDRKLNDRTSPLGPHGKAHNQEQQSATEIFSFGSRPPVEVTSEEGEEVEQAAVSPGTHSQAPLMAPLGVCFNPKENRKVLLSASVEVDTCYNNTELPDTNALRKKLERQLAAEGIIVSTYCANLINSGLDMFLKGLLKPCLNLAGSRPVGRTSLSLTDFEAAMQLDPRVLGKDWPVVLEKVRFHGFEDNVDG